MLASTESSVIYPMTIIEVNGIKCPALLGTGSGSSYASEAIHCVNSVQIRSYFWSVFSCIQSKYRKPVTTPYLDTFHAVIIDLLKTNPIRKEYNTIETLTIATTRKLKTYTFFL